MLSNGPPSNPNTAILILQLATLAVTVIGWFYTAVRQLAILRESREYQRKDRDLAIYRARMDKATNLSKSIIEASDYWYKLAAFAKATVDDGKTKDFQRLAEPLLRDASFSKLNLAIILYDPQFRSLRNLLDKAVSKKISDSLVASENKIRDFFDRTYSMQPTDPDIVQQVEYVFEGGRSIADSLVDAANEFANAFATLDQILTQNS